MKVLGIVSSPRRDQGLSHKVMSAVLAGARSAGAETETIYLVDDDPQYCVHCGYSCFADGDCARDVEATIHSQRVSAADALVLAVPVYCWQPNGIAASFFDKVRLATGPWTRDEQHGRPALGIAVAGGTGTGVYPALQSIYSWFCLWKYRPLDPLPVTRFNIRRVLDEAGGHGEALARFTPQPYAGVWEEMLTYDRLPAMSYGRVEEFRWLAEQAALGLEERGERLDLIQEVRRLLEAGRACAERQDTEGEAQQVVAAYLAGREGW